LLSWETRRPRPAPAIRSGTSSAHPDSPRDDRDDQDHADERQPEPHPDDAGRASVPGLLPHQEGDGEHGEGQWSQGEARLHGVVLKGHLQVEGKGDHGATEGDLLEHHLESAHAEVRHLEQVRVEQCHLAFALTPYEPTGQQGQGHGTDGHEQSDELAAFLPDQDAQNHPAHA